MYKSSYIFIEVRLHVYDKGPKTLIFPVLKILRAIIYFSVDLKKKKIKHENLPRSKTTTIYCMAIHRALEVTA